MVMSLRVRMRPAHSPGIFMMSLRMGVILRPSLCRSGISFISASFHRELLMIAFATSLQGNKKTCQQKCMGDNRGLRDHAA